MTNRDKEQHFDSAGRDVAKRLLRHESAVLIMVLAGIVAIIGVATDGKSTSVNNVRNVLLQSSIRGVASVGQAFVILTAGIDVSIGGMALVTAVLGGSLITEGPKNIVGIPIPVYIVIPIMLLAGIGVGVSNGAFVSRLRVPPLIVTLAMWQMTRGAAYQIGGGYTIVDFPQSLAFVGQGHVGIVPVPVIIFISVVAVAYFVLYHTTYGRSVYAVGGSPVNAWLSGINVRNILLFVYVISGFLAALAGLIAISRTMAASPITAGGLEIDTIASVCIGGVSLTGGKGTVIGAVIGVIIIGVLNNGMNIMEVHPALQDLVKGAIILLAVTIDVQRRRS